MEFRVSTPVMKRGTDWLKGHFLSELAPYDVVVGYHADDSYFSFARAAFRVELERAGLDGLYMRDMIREEVLPNDPCLR